MTNSNERKDILRRDNRCFTCLGMGHCITRCESKESCTRCHRRHRQSICEVSKTTKHAPPSTKDNKPKPPSNDGEPPATNETSNTRAVTVSTKETTPPENLVTKNPFAPENSANPTTPTSTKSRNKVLLQTAVIYAKETMVRTHYRFGYF